MSMILLCPGAVVGTAGRRPASVLLSSLLRGTPAAIAGARERAGGGDPAGPLDEQSCSRAWIGQRLPVTLMVIRPTLSLSTWIFVPVFGTITLVYGVRSS